MLPPFGSRLAALLKLPEILSATRALRFEANASRVLNTLDTAMHNNPLDAYAMAYLLGAASEGRYNSSKPHT